MCDGLIYNGNSFDFRRFFHEWADSEQNENVEVFT